MEEEHRVECHLKTVTPGQPCSERTVFQQVSQEAVLEEKKLGHLWKIGRP